MLLIGSRINNKAIQILFHSIFFLIVGILTFFILYNANWILGDDIMFIWSTAIGETTHTMIGSGRFVLFAFKEFNILNFIPFGHSPLAHYILISISFIIFSLMTIALYRSIARSLNTKNLMNYKILFIILLCFFALVVSPTFMEMFFQTIFPERMVILLFALFLFFYFKGVKTDKLIFYIAALICAILATYYKEPVFGALIVISLTSLLLNYKKLSTYQKYFYFALIANGVVFCVLYYFMMFSKSTEFYNEGRVIVSRIEIVKEIFFQHKIFFIFLGLAFIRFYFILVKNDRVLIFDGFLFSGIAYIIAYVFLKLNASYYFTPVYVLAMPSLLYCVIYYINRKKYSYLISSILILLIIFSFYSFGQLIGTINSIQERRVNDMRQIEKIAEYIREGKEILWYQLKIETPGKLFSNNLMEDRLVKFNTFTRFSLGRDPLKGEDIFKKISKLNSPLTANQILFYPLENRDSEKDDDKIYLRGDLKKIDYFYNTNVYIYKDKPKLPFSMCFSSDCSQEDYSIKGVSNPESWGRWSMKDEVKIKFQLKDVPRKDLLLSAKINAFLHEKNSKILVDVYVNDEKIGTWNFDYYDEKTLNEKKKLIIPGHLVRKNALFDILFKINGANRPIDLGISEDTRKLGIGLENLEISEIK